jgi:hypothetical protein
LSRFFAAAVAELSTSQRLSIVNRQFSDYLGGCCDACPWFCPRPCGACRFTGAPGLWKPFSMGSAFLLRFDVLPL